MSAGRLVLVPNALDLGTEETPLHDVIGDGALRVAATLRHWAVEDARSARAFLERVRRRHALGVPLQEQRIVELPRPRKGSGEPVAAAQWRSLLQPVHEGHDLGLLSEAGLPAVADPGAALVQAAHEVGIAVCALAGPSSLTLALAASGLNGQSFAFVGYLPRDAAARSARLKELEAASRRLQQTQIVIETPYRNAALLGAMSQALAADTRVSVSCGLTLPGGWTKTASVAQWRATPAELPDRVPAVFCFLAGSTGKC